MQHSMAHVQQYAFAGYVQPRIKQETVGAPTHGLPAYPSAPRSMLSGMPAYQQMQYAPPVAPMVPLPLPSAVENATKRALESGGYQQDAKRRCVQYQPRCIHCYSPGHVWSQCEGFCIACLGVHPRRRCTKIPHETYIGAPRGFDVLERYDEHESKKMLVGPVITDSKVGSPVMEGINPQRVAMIAVTPDNVSDMPEVDLIGAGPQRSQANLLPLGPRKVSDDGRQLALASWPKPSNPMWDGLDEKTWMALASHIYATVRGSVDESKVCNNGGDQETVDKYIRAALNVLKPTIMRQRKSKYSSKAQ